MGASVAKSPRGRSARWAVVPALFLLAGCLQPRPVEEWAEPDPDSAAAVTVRVDEDRGAIRGIVLSIELLPLGDARILLSPGGDLAITSQEGEYGFELVVPGSYQVSVQAADYRPQAKEIFVTAGEVSRLTFILEPVPKGSARLQEYQYTAYIACGFGFFVTSTTCGMNDPNQKLKHRFNVERGLTTLVVSAEWTPVQNTGSRDGTTWLLFQLLNPPGNVFREWMAPPPNTTTRLSWEWSEAHYNSTKGNWSVAVLPSRGNASQQYLGNSGLIFGQRVELYLALAYFGYPLSEDHTGVPRP